MAMPVQSESEPLAIIGLAFRFPQDATSVEGFWRILEERRCVMTDIPAKRMDIDRFYHPNERRVNKLNLRGAHCLKQDLGTFDAPFFSISPEEAAAMDPQQRGLLETSYHALENAGIPIEAVSGSDTAVFTGSFGDDYRICSLKDPECMSSYAGTGTSFSILANRLSWWYNLKGPSVSMDTACSSSLVALHLACQSLRTQESSMALVGGSHILSSVEQFLLLSNLSMLSPSSCSYSFDHRANGYGRGEGYGVVVVKRLSDALSDGDVIRAVIRATGTNQDGRTPSLTSPSQEAQQRLIRDTYRRSGLDLATTAFVEGHGTGTAIGDPIEARVLGSVFGVERKEGDPLYIGSVKSNIGHLEGASGIAGLIKAILALERGVIPPNANFEKTNPRIDTKGLNIAFPTESVTWPSTGLRRASVNSFGFGGSNCHIVLDDACNFLKAKGLRGRHISIDLDNQVDSLSLSPGQRLSLELAHPTNTIRGPPKLLIWSASDSKASSRLLKSYSEFFSLQHNEANSSYLDELAFTLATRRSLLPSRIFAIANSSSQLANLSAIASKPIRARDSRKLGFVFTGQGGQYSNMGEQLLTYPIFKHSIERSNNYLRGLGCKWDLLAELARPEKETRIHEPEYSQPLCTALQIALVDLLSSVCIRPHSVVGHSSGEIAAAYSIGALSHESAIKVVYLRGQVAASLTASSKIKGAMLAASLSEPQAIQYLINFRKAKPLSTVVIACINSPSSVTLAGDETAIDALEAQLNEDGVFGRKLHVSVAYHSPHMTRASRTYRNLMGVLQPGECQYRVPPVMVSSVTGHLVNASQMLDPEYWVQNMESPVIFSQAVAKVMSTPNSESVDGAMGHTIFEPPDMLEIGPHSVLRGPVQDIVASLEIDIPVHYDSVLNRSSGAVLSFLGAMGRLHCLGHQVDVPAINGLTGEVCSGIKPLTSLPPYPFDSSKTYWHESKRSSEFRHRKVPRSDSMISSNSFDGAPQMSKRWRRIIRVADKPWVSDHIVNGVAIYPAAGMISMTIEAVRQTADQTKKISAFCIKEAEFLRPIYISNDNEGVESHIELKPWSCLEASSHTTSFTICTLAGETWVENCCGTVLVEYDGQTQGLNRHVTLDNSHLMQNISVNSMYESFDSVGLTFGPNFRSLTQVAVGPEHQARSEINTFRNGDAEDHVIHPITLDGIFQTIQAALTQTSSHKLPTTVPTRIQDLWIAGTGAAYPAILSLQATAKVEQQSAGNTMSTASACDRNGESLVYIGCLQTTFVDSIGDTKQDLGADDTCYHIAWRPDIDLLDRDSAPELFQMAPGVGDSDESGHFEDLSVLLLHIFERVLGRFDLVKIDPTRPYLHHYVKWMKHYISHFESNFGSREKWASILTDERVIATLSEKVYKTSTNGRGLVEIGHNLLKILYGELDPLELIFKSNFAEQYYREFNALTEPALRHILELIAFKDPGLKVLEIGAGTGSTTELVLKYANIQADKGAGLSAVSSYDFTDVSPAFFSPAREKFASHGDKMKFSVLDISKDPLAQGFREGRYDLIVAAIVLHATPDLDATLSNARRLLKRGGKLVILEITENQWLPQVIFGTLPGWWLSNDEYRTLGPCISTASWDQVFSRNGFSGADIVAHDTSDPRSRLCSVLVTSAVGDDLPTEAWPHTVILADTGCSRAGAVAEIVRTRLLGRNPSSVEVLSLSNVRNKDFSDKFCISLLELATPLLASMNEEEFMVLRGLLSKVSGIVWVRDKGDAVPALHLSDGLFRVLRSENVGPKYVTLAVSTTTSSEKTAGSIMRVVGNTLSQLLGNIELEYKEVEGHLSISRAVPATSVNNHIKNAAHHESAASIFDPDATYVIAGGFGTIARSVCRWMAKRGARHLLLLSRSGPASSPAQALIRELAAQKVRVEYPTCDISSVADLQRALDTCASRLPPIRGCIQGAAAVRQDSVFAATTHAQWTAGLLGPRVAGTQNLLDLLPDTTSLFVLLSSTAGVLGSPSQAAHAATGAYLDAFAHARSTAAKPVVALDVGPVDLAARREPGCASEAHVLALLGYFCDPAWLAGGGGGGVPAQTVAGITYRQQHRSGPSLLDRPLWRALRLLGRQPGKAGPSTSTSTSTSTADPGRPPLSSLLARAGSASEAARVVLGAVSAKLAASLGVEEREAVRAERPAHEAGVDSLMAVQLRAWFRGEVGADVGVAEIMGPRSLRELSWRAAEGSEWVRLK